MIKPFTQSFGGNIFALSGFIESSKVDVTNLLNYKGEKIFD